MKLKYLNKMFGHYIITRFNLRRGDWKTTKNDELVLNDEWLEERFELFQNFCFPSVKNQLNNNFKWLVFFDINTPESYKSIVEKLSKEFPRFQPYYIDGMDQFLPSVKNKIEEICKKEYVITSRLDNDDCISNNYVGEVQNYFDSQHFLAIDLIDGYTLSTGSEAKLGFKRQFNNPFISLIEKNNANLKSVWYLGHGSWKYEERVKSVSNNRLWMSIIHAKNKVNEFTGFGNVDLEVLNEFSISSTKKEELISNFINVKLWRLESTKNYLIIMLSQSFKTVKRTLGIYKIKKKISKNRLD